MSDKGDVKIIAEIGGNHEGDFHYACKLLELAAQSGADIVKFQIYTGPSLVNEKQDPDRVAHFNKFALTTSQYLELAQRAGALEIEFNASIWDQSQISIFDPLVKFYKIGSGDLTAYPLLKAICKTQKPIMLSTGLATMKEVEASINYICRENDIYKQADMISLLQCTAMYPIPDRDANLNIIQTYKNTFPYKIGYSDHTAGTYAAEIAVAMGAEILELHFTDQKDNRDFRDHQVSFTKDDIQKLRNRIDDIKTLQGASLKAPAPSELESCHVKSFRRALYPARDIRAGEIITHADLIALRPNHGISADQLEMLIGKTAARDLTQLERLDPKDFRA